MLNINTKSAYFDNKNVLKDTFMLVITIIITTIILIKFDISKTIYTFIRNNEELVLDEIIIVLAISSIYMFFFMLKRFFELKELVEDANTDPLIGILNRRKGSKYIAEEIAHINITNYKSSLIMYDVDDFKNINDSYGHDIGDYVLKEISNVIEEETRVNDISIRWGGEEFIVICPNTSLDDATKLAERFRVSIESHDFKNKIKITASFGVIELHENEDFRKQIIRVDNNLYTSKKNGKNKVTK